MLKIILILSTCFIILNADYIRNHKTDIVVDTSTGLMWTDQEKEVLSWKDALDYCDEYKINGNEDWRMPNYNELNSLVDINRSNPSISDNFHFKPSSLFWTSTASTIPNNVWLINFSTGSSSDNGFDITQDELYKFNIRCVHTLVNY